VLVDIKGIFDIQEYRGHPYLEEQDEQNNIACSSYLPVKEMSPLIVFAQTMSVHSKQYELYRLL
jgi:hypothetical protein